jgi:3-phenylpropionate/trans-cinnamate dioxygenase ferredoxin reductase component
MSAGEPVTVVGNGISGWACATRLAERGVPVRMIGPGLPHDRPPLSKRALERGSVPYLADRLAIAERGIVHLDGVVDRVDLARRALWARPSGGGGALELRFGPLVWATGLRIRRPPVPGGELTDQNASAADMEALLPRLARGGRRVAVIGAGLIGSETAATLARRHRVTLIERADRPLERFPEPIGHAASAALADAGVRVLAACSVDRIEYARRGDRAVVVTGEHGSLPFDVVIGATGVATTLVPGVGVEGEPVLDTDETLAVLGRDGVWACGDLARHPHPRHGRIVIPHWDHARASGAHVAEAILGQRGPYVREPYWFSDVGRLRVQQVGLAAAACEWRLEDGLHVGRDADGRPACVVLLDLPSRLKDARGLVAA